MRRTVVLAVVGSAVGRLRPALLGSLVRIAALALRARCRPVAPFAALLWA